MQLNKNTTYLAALAFIVTLSMAITGAGCTETPTNQTVQENKETAESIPTSTTNPPQTDMEDMHTQVEIDTTPATPTRTIATTTKTSVVKPTTATTRYKDGTYTADGVYTSPAGAEHLPVSLTIKTDLVTDANVQVVATNAKSKYMQQQFVDGFKTYVIGKKLSDVNVGKVSGSSLTGIGFNDAVTKIKTQASL